MMAGGRPLRIVWAAGDTTATLHAAFRTSADPRAALRAQALRQLQQGHSERETAALLGVHERRVRQWVAWYRVERLAGVLAHKAAGHGKPAFLSTAPRRALVEHLATGAVYTAQDAVAWGAAEFGVTSRLGGMATLLRRLRCRPKVPRPQHPKPTHELQVAWNKGGVPRR